jgi:branched-chain amino acid transport system substrate-binding protein
MPSVCPFFGTSLAEKAGADPLGYYVAPLAYAQMQVLEQAIRAVGSTDDAALVDYTRKATFDTVLGNVTFGEGGVGTAARADRAVPEHRQQQHLGIQEAQYSGGRLSA